MRKNKVRFKLLMALLNEGYAYDNVLRTLDDKTAFINKCISEMIEGGYIKTGKRSVTRRYKGKKKDIDFSYKIITRKGVQWLIDNYAEEHTWLKYLPDPMPKFCVNKHLANNAVYCMIKSITASIMFANVGVRTFNKVNDAYTEELRDIVSKAKEQYRRENGIRTADLHKGEDGWPLIYFHNKDIKKYISKEEKTEEQYAFFENHGLLINHSKSYLVYVTKVGGILFRKGEVERIISAMKDFIAKKSFTDEPYGPLGRCIVFCKNEKEFAELFFRNYKANKRNGGRMSDSFGSIHVRPVLRKSMTMLSLVLENVYGYDSDAIVRLRNTDVNFSTDKFQVSGLYRDTLIGIDMDLVKIASFFELMEKVQNRNYKVVCYKWQESYYRRIMPENIEYYIVPDNLMVKK